RLDLDSPFHEAPETRLRHRAGSALAAQAELHPGREPPKLLRPLRGHGAPRSPRAPAPHRISGARCVFLRQSARIVRERRHELLRNVSTHLSRSKEGVLEPV